MTSPPIISPQTIGFYGLNVSPVHFLLSIFPIDSVLAQRPTWNHFLPELLEQPSSWSLCIMSCTSLNAKLIISLPSATPFDSSVALSVKMNRIGIHVSALFSLEPLSRKDRVDISLIFIPSKIQLSVLYLLYAKNIFAQYIGKQMKIQISVIML